MTVHCIFQIHCEVRRSSVWICGSRSASEFSSARYLSVIAEVLNATSAQEVLSAQCGTICQADKSGPVVLPSIGIEAGF